jgi:glycosyltransferase involved in cell wall biosynthesis
MNSSNSNLPLVSVIIPAYNAEAFISETLKSVLAQTYQNIEVLVVDDGSQDRTSEIVESFAANDSRIKLLRQSNQGATAARNLAIEKSKGEFIAPIDADDIWYPQNLEKQVQCIIQADSSVGLVYAWSAHIDEKGLRMGNGRTSTLEGDVYLSLIQDNFVGNGSTPLIRRDCFDKVGGYNYKLKEENAEGCADWDLYLRIAECYEFRVVPEFLVGYRQLGSSMSSNYKKMLKSYSLVMAEAQQRNPQLPPRISQASRVNFYVYLSYQTRRQGNHWDTFYWLYKALNTDPISILKNRQLWKHTFTSFLKLVAQPITSLVWPNYSDWMQFKRRFTFNKQADESQLL